MKKLWLTIVALLLAAGPASAQFNTRGTQSYRNALTSNNEFGLPRFTTALLPACSANNLGAKAWDLTTSEEKVCNGSSWAVVGGTAAIDACPQTAAHSICKGDSTLEFEGASANDFETTITVTDPGVDVTFTIGDSPDGNPWIGATAGDSSAAAEVDNVLLGSAAGTALNGTATDNVFIGDAAGDGATTGDNGVLIGANADYSTVTDGNGVAIGADSVLHASNSVAIGYQAETADGVSVGQSAGTAMTSDDLGNTFVGDNAASSAGAAVEALNNTCLGNASCLGLTSGDSNVGVGGGSLATVTTGSGNVVLGLGADVAVAADSNGVALGTSAKSGGDGVSIGASAGNTQGAGDADNVFVGNSAGTAANGTSTDNTCLGDLACDGLTTGDGNVVIGADADILTATESNLIAIGFGAVAGATGGLSIGYNAGASSAATGLRNTLIGFESGDAVTTGDDNVTLGYQAGSAVFNNSGWTAVGSKACDTETGASVTCIGANTSSATQGTAVGNLAIVYGTAGVAIGLQTETSDGVSIGAVAGNAMAAADVDNTFVGRSAGALASGTSTDNTCVGDLSCATLTTGDGNVVIGADSDLAEATASNAVVVGFGAIAEDNSVSIGYQAGATLVSGADFNTLVGYQAGTAMNNTGDDHNTFVGYQAGDAVSGEATQNTCLGSGACGTSTTADNNVMVGYSAIGSTAIVSKATVIGWSAQVHADKGVAVGRAAITADGVSIGNIAGDAQTSDDLHNVFVGQGAGGAAGAGVVSTDNTCIGDLACDALTAGDRNVMLGANTDVGTATFTDTTVLGESMVTGASDSILLGFGGQAYQYVHGAGQTIVDNVADDIVTLSVADDTMVGAVLEYTVTAIEADEYQVASEVVAVAIENDSGAEACTFNAGASALHGGGTMPLVHACTAGADVVTITMAANSSLGAPATTMVAYWSIRILGPATAITIP